MNFTMVGPVVYGRKNRLKTYLPDSKETEILRRFLMRAKPGGIDVYVVLGIHAMEKELDHRFSLANPEDKKLLASIISNAAKLKIYGFALNFDDIQLDFPTKKDEEKYQNIGEMQCGVIKFVKNAAAKSNIDKIIVCPTLYRSHDIYGMHGDPAEYFKYLMKTKDVDFFHCAYRRKDLDKLKSFGFRNWIWWYNGPFTIFGEGGYSTRARPKGYWVGFRRLYWGWYNTYLHPQRGLCVYGDTIDELKNIKTASNVLGAFMSGGGPIERYRNLLFLWSPSRFNEQQGTQAMLALCFGKENIKDYLNWQSISRKWIIYFIGGPKLNTAYKDVERRLSNDLMVAKQATDNIKKRLSMTSVNFPNEAAKALKKMTASNNSLARRLEMMKTKRSIVTVTPERKIKWGIGPTSYNRYIRDIHFVNGYSSIYLQYVIAEHANKKYDIPFLFNGGGLCFLAPSGANWGDLGFFGIRLGDSEIQHYKADVSKIQLTSGVEACQMRWKMRTGEVIAVMHLDKDGSLAMDIKAIPVAPTSDLTLLFYCNPNAGRDAACGTQKKLKGWDRCFLTAGRDLRISAKTPVNLSKESWLVLYDKNYNTGYDFERKPDFLNIAGPAAILYNHNDFAFAHVQLRGKYSVKGYFRLKRDIRHFKIKLYDLKVKSKEDIKAYLEDLSKNATSQEHL